MCCYPNFAFRIDIVAALSGNTSRLVVASRKFPPCWMGDPPATTPITNNLTLLIECIMIFISSSRQTAKPMFKLKLNTRNIQYTY